MKTLHRFGIVLLAAGFFLVLGVITLWATAPLALPAAQQQPPLDSAASLAAPALSTIVPAQAVADQIHHPTAGNAPNPVPTPTSTRNGPPTPPVADTLDEEKAVGARDRQSEDDFFRLAIPALDIDAPVTPVSLREMFSPDGRTYNQWAVPNAYAVGWHDASAFPGQAGNTVLNGHNNVYGAVFGNLVDLTLGERIILYDDQQQYIFQVVHREFMPEKGEPLRTRLRNARWILPSDDIRLTLVTCWPNTTNTHRLVVVAEALAPQASHLNGG